ncbi:hypothetical protein NS334_15190 [Sphingomonas endophytica]|uniref:DUF3429 domain-containing protein n=1 Tax=Sphingomonas endophytica TaxID=869719 RepID=A0A147HWA4_9SPHN|nr:hypothetical protein NS334_15190 [Sphingomonas endophytica]
MLRRPPRALGAAGLLPQVACVVVGLLAPAWGGHAVIAGGVYAAVILSFLGGMWWMQALCRGEPRWWPYGLAVVPSLIAWAALLPWLAGSAAGRWPLVALAAALLVSPAGDRSIGSFAGDVPAWRRLRHLLSGGLGAMTLLLATLPAAA